MTYSKIARKLINRYVPILIRINGSELIYECCCECAILSIAHSAARDTSAAAVACAYHFGQALVKFNSESLAIDLMIKLKLGYCSIDNLHDRQVIGEP